MRLIIARCEVNYSGRLASWLPPATRVVMLKADGAVMIHADSGGFKPLNWMTAPTIIEETDSEITVRKPRSEEQLRISLEEIFTDVTYELGEIAGLQKDGVESELQQLLANAPHWCGEGFTLIRREWFTDIGPVDLMCRDAEEQYVAVEIKRVAGIDAVEQLTRYLHQIRKDPAFEECRGALVAQIIKPQAKVLARERGIECVEVDLEVLRGEREPELTLFG